MRMVWEEWNGVPDPPFFGHGVEFHDIKREEARGVVAFVAGYDWLHGNPPEVVVRCIKPDGVTSARVLNSARRKIEALILKKKVPNGMVTERIKALPNA